MCIVCFECIWTWLGGLEWCLTIDFVLLSILSSIVSRKVSEISDASQGAIPLLLPPGLEYLHMGTWPSSSSSWFLLLVQITWFLYCNAFPLIFILWVPSLLKLSFSYVWFKTWLQFFVISLPSFYLLIWSLKNLLNCELISGFDQLKSL